jgi:hypothetical protein
LQPQDLVEVSRNPGTLPDPQRGSFNELQLLKHASDDFFCWFTIVNGYPELPYVSLQRRVPKGWWDNQERRNFGETVSRM